MKRNHFLQLIICSLAILFSFSAQAQTISRTEAESWINDKGQQLLDTFNESDLSRKYQKLDQLFGSHVDLDYIGKFVIGKYWRKMTPEQQQKYQNLFKRYALAVYKTFPLSFENKIGFEINNVMIEQDYADVSAGVDTGQKNASGQPQKFLVVFRIVRNDNDLKIIDLKLAESSLILSYRSRFYQMVANADEDIGWFLEDLETSVVSTEKTNALRLEQER